ncbi:hypothetical protein RRG08_049170 [Elysia crispata]|uniref:Uncharacterized protein n=1 Tax=Elysia crispata TaxID=231223 RepID=A0AAE1ASD8_9GAST|nr:hypothetical protein RRG08_049170 [Elysia crispata]
MVSPVLLTMRSKNITRSYKLPSSPRDSTGVHYNRMINTNCYLSHYCLSQASGIFSRQDVSPTALFLVDSQHDHASLPRVTPSSANFYEVFGFFPGGFFSPSDPTQ